MKKNQLLIGLIIIAIICAIVANSLEHRAQEPEFAKQNHENVADAKNYFKIPELEIRFEVPEELNDLEYKIIEIKNNEENPQSFIYFSTKSISDTAEKDCPIMTGPLGALSTTYKFPNDGDKPLPSETKIIGKLYASYNNPQSVCTDNAELKSQITRKSELLRQSLNSLQTLNGEFSRNLEQGLIESSLVAPRGSKTSQMQVCAINTKTSESFCSGQGSLIVDQKYTGGYGYILNVPVGNYTIYASLARNPRDPNSYRAFYSEYVRCFSKENFKNEVDESCTDHTPVTVEVKPNETISNISHFDWQNTGNQSILSDVHRIMTRNVNLP